MKPSCDTKEVKEQVKSFIKSDDFQNISYPIYEIQSLNDSYAI